MQVVRLLLRDSDVNATCEPGQKTPLMLAVENMHLKCAVHILSTRRVDANVVDDNGKCVHARSHGPLLSRHLPSHLGQALSEECFPCQ
jgi:hypothetical protein